MAASERILRGVKPSAYSIDALRFPLVVGRATPSVHDDAALDETYRQCEALLARGQRFVVMFDLRGGASSSRRRKRVADWIIRHEATITSLIVAMAIIVGNELERGFVTAVKWLKPQPVPVRVFTDEREAEQWLLGEYARA